MTSAERLLRVVHALAAAAGALVVLAATPSVAEEIKLAIEPGPYYVNQPVRLRLTVSGFEREPKPDVELLDALPSHLTLSLIDVATHRSMSVVTVNGRVTRDESVIFQYIYSISSARPGAFELGPFKATQGTLSATGGQVSLQFQEVPTSDNMHVSLELEDRPYYAGERIPITIRWSYVGNLQSLDDLNITAPGLEQFDLDPIHAPDQRLAITVPAAGGLVKLPITHSRSGYGGNETLEYVAEAEIVTHEAGNFELEPITATVREVTRWSRDDTGDLFGGFGIMGPRRADESRIIKAVGQPIHLSVRPLPVKGQPDSFGGVIGRQYEIEVEANRTVVHVGDPLNLTVTLLGDRALQNARLPDLSADGGMSPSQFRLPPDLPAGVFRDGRRQFQVTVRVTDPSVTEIPPLAYSWFDPLDERYVTTHSQPIALRVLPSNVVSSDDVVSAQPREARDSLPPEQEPASGGSIETLSGFDLSIEEDIDRWVRPTASTVRPTAVPYTLGLAAVGWAIVDRRRKRRLADGGASERLITRQVSQIDSARALAPRDAAAQVAGALRQLLTHASAEQRAVADRLIGRAEQLIFAPPESTGPALDSSFFDEARQVARSIAAAAPAERAMISRTESLTHAARTSRRRVPRTLWMMALPLLIAYLIAPPCPAASFREVAQQAIDIYRQALDEPDRAARLDQFGRAAQLFRQAAVAPPAGARVSASLWTNAANAALQAEDLGQAILAYRRALAVNPRYTAANTNLQLARQQLPTQWQPPATLPVWDRLVAWTTVFNGRGPLWAAYAFCLAALLWAASVRMGRPTLRHLAVIPLLVWAVLLFSTLVVTGSPEQRPAVLVADDTVARTADSRNAPIQFADPLPAGVELEVIESRLDWLRAELPNGEATWLPKSSVEFIL